MARKKKTRIDEIQDFVSEKESIIEDIIKPAIVDHNREKVLDWSSKGYNANQIAGMLKLHKHIVENIIRNG